MLESYKSENRIIKELRTSKFWQVILFYVLIISIDFGLSYFLPMGPCADVPAAIAMLIVISTLFVSLFLLIKSIIGVIKKDKSSLALLYVHITFWIGYFLLVLSDI